MKISTNQSKLLTINSSYFSKAGGFANDIQWNLSIKDTLNKGHLSNEDTACSPNHIELCTNLALN